MDNSKIAALFDELADLMELAGENYFKIRAYRNAAGTIRELNKPLKEIAPGDIAGLPGIGKAISEKIGAALEEGTFPTLEKWRASGVAAFRPLAGVDGMNIRKLRGMIRNLNLETLGDLKIAMDNGAFDAYKKLDSRLKQIIKTQIQSNHG